MWFLYGYSLQLMPWTRGVYSKTFYMYMAKTCYICMYTCVLTHTYTIQIIYIIVCYEQAETGISYQQFNNTIQQRR